MKKILLFLICFILISISLYFGVDYLSTKKIDLIEVIVASRDIGPREIIEVNDIKTIFIPRDYVLENAINKPEEIIGKITSLQGLIPKDSLFYKTQLDSINKIPDAAVPLLQRNEVAFHITNDSGGLDLSTFIIGQTVDIYGAINQRNETPIFDLLLSSVRVVSIKDRKGIEIGKESTGSPYSITLAINQDHISILSMIRKTGTLELYATSKSYSGKESKLNEDSKILEFIK